MKILFITPERAVGMGGVQKHVRLLTKELRRRGHEVRELELEKINSTSSTGNTSTDSREGSGSSDGPRSIRSVPSRLPRPPTSSRGPRNDKIKKLAAWRYLWERRNLLDEADVIHIHDVFWWIAPLLIANTLRRKTYITFHGWEGQCPPNWSAVIQKRIAAQVCRGVLGVGTFIEKWYGVKLDEVTYGAIEESNTSSTSNMGNTGAELRERSDPSIMQVSFFGRLEEVNGIQIVIDAFLKLKTRGFKVRFIGDGKWHRNAEEAGPVLGMVRQPEKYLLESKVVVTCSYLAMMETMALGKPIVAISHNRLKEDYLTMHPEAANFAICRSAVELARTVADKNLLPTEGRIEAAKRWAREQTPEKLAENYLRLWKRKIV